jgi:hypothetical protein
MVYLLLRSNEFGYEKNDGIAIQIEYLNSRNWSQKIAEIVYSKDIRRVNKRTVPFYTRLSVPRSL